LSSQGVGVSGIVVHLVFWHARGVRKPAGKQYRLWLAVRTIYLGCRDKLGGPQKFSGRTRSSQGKM
jgi:hypothetical protein